MCYVLGLVGSELISMATDSSHRLSGKNNNNEQISQVGYRIIGPLVSSTELSVLWGTVHPFSGFGKIKLEKT